MPISSDRCQDLFDYLETMRLPEEPNMPEEITPQVEEKTGGDNSSSPIDRLNDPSMYCAQVPFLIYDENKETIISRTAKGINEGKLNPYEVNWMEVTLYEIMFVKPLLESIDSAFLMDVAQAIDDEEARQAREDGQYTTVSSDFYGTGQGLAFFYSHTIDNWDNDISSVSAISIAEGIIDKRKKAEAYQKKVNEKIDNQTTELKKHIVEIIDEPESHLQIQMRESIIDQNIEDEINALKRECEEWKKKYEESITKEPEKAFNAQTGNPCFTNRQMGILLTAVGRITEKDNPPGKTTLGEIVEKISGYKATTASSNMRGAMPEADINAVVAAIKSKFPNLAAEVSKV
jgi:hypothetical protein